MISQLAIKKSASFISLTGIKKTKIPFYLASVVIVFSSVMNNSDASNQESLKKLSQINSNLSSRGYSCSRGGNGIYLQQGSSYVVLTALVKKRDYILVAAGSANVKEMDIVLHDEKHNIIENNNAKDPTTPSVQASPKWTGEFHAKIKMHRGNGYSNLLICYR